jgi:hypothetical protein
MRSWIVASFLMLAPALAAAQVVCPTGLVPVDATHCCWPGQALSPDGQACAGTPQCPQGLVPYGATCVPAPAEVAPPPPMSPPPLPGAQTPPPSAGGGFPVRFEARNEGYQFTVSVDGGASCSTPCDLTVTPGKHSVKVEGDATYQDDLDFPATPARVTVDKRRGGYLALGITSLAVGVPTAIGGVAVTLVGLVRVLFTSSNSPPGSGAQTEAMVLGGLGMMVGGVVLAAVGGSIGLRKAGHSKVHLRKSELADAESAPVRLTGSGVAPTSGGAMVGATFAF